MTNPTLEQRARELFEIARPNFHYAKRGTADGGAFEQSEIGRCLMNAMKAIASSPTFSHTGVEQAIEVCAKDGWVMVPREPTEEMLAYGTGLTDFCFPDGGTHDNTPAGWEKEMRMAWGTMLDHAPKYPDASPLPAQSPDAIAYTGPHPIIDARLAEDLAYVAHKPFEDASNLQKTQIGDGEGEVTERVHIMTSGGRLVGFGTERGGGYPIEKMPASPVNVEGLVEAVDAWMNNPCPETEQLILDARRAPQPRSERE